MPDNHRYQSSPHEIQDVAVMGIIAATIVSSLITTFTAAMMALGAGLGSTPESRVPFAANILWTIGGFAFIPCGVLALLTLIPRKRLAGYLLGICVILSGLCVAGGWLINATGRLPGGTTGNTLFILVSVIPVLAGGLIIWLSRGRWIESGV